MAPQTIELYGGALNALNSLLNSGTSPAIESIVHMFGLWMANIDIYLGKQGAMNGVLQHGQGYLSQFGQFIGNVAAAIGNLIKSDPGTAHFLMDLLTGFSKLLNLVTQLPSPILTAVLALHSIWLWGGLLATQIARLLGPLAAMMVSLGGLDKAGTAVANLGKDASGLERMKAIFSDIAVGAAAFAGNIAGYFKTIGTSMIAAEGAAGKAAAGIDAAMAPLKSAFAWLAANPFVVLIAGLAAAAYGYTQLGASARSATGAIVSGAEQLPASQAILGGLTSAQEQLVQKMHQIPGAAADAKTATGSFAAGVAQSGNVLTGVADVTAHWIISLVNGKRQIDAFQGGIVKLTQDQANLFGETGNLVKQGYSVSQSWALMDLAGVKAGDSMKQMDQEVKNLITGYQNLGIRGGLLGNAVNAVTFAVEMQDSKVQQITQAFTQFIGTVTGGQAAFISFAQQVQGTFQAAGGAANSLSMSNGKVRDSIKNLGGAAGPATVSMNGLTTSSLNLRQSFIQSVTDGSNVINTLLTLSAAGAQGAKGTAMVTQAGKDLVAQMLPLARGSKDATTELYALAQTAGYQGADSFKALAQWVGNVKNPMQNLNSIESALMGTSATLSKDVQNLANAIGQNLNQAMAAAILQARGGQAAFNNFANAAIHAHGNMDVMKGSATQLAQELITTTGNTSQAKGEFETFAGMLNITKSQADTLWDSVTKLSNGIHNVPTGHGTNFTSNVGAVITSVNQLAQAIQNLPSTKYITIVEQGVSYGISAGGAASPHAAGYLVPGYGGGDRHPALLEGGEAVVPKHLTAAVAPFLKAHGVPGFASGTTNVANRAAAAAQDAAMLAKFFPVPPIPHPAAAPPQFMGEWLPSSMIGVPAPAAAGGGTPTGSGGATGSTPPGQAALAWRSGDAGGHSAAPCPRQTGRPGHMAERAEAHAKVQPSE